MNLTHEHLPLLRAARDLIESGKELFICYALVHTPTDDDVLFDACHKHIYTGIPDAAYLSDWVRNQVPDPVWWLQGGATSYNAPRRAEAVTQQRLMRLAWLDRIIWDIEHAE
jgi:hypothetical protein